VTDIGRVALAARVFTVTALVSLGTLAGPSYLTGALLVALTAVTALVLAQVLPVNQSTLALGEGAAVALLVVLVHPGQTTVTPYLVTPVLIAALDAGRRGLLRAVGTELVVLVVGWLVVEQRWDRTMAASGFTWLATAVGIGMMGLALRQAMVTRDDDASYRSAVGLIRRLEALSGKLSGGLDSIGIAEQVMSEAETLVPTRGAAVFVRSTQGAVTALRYSHGSHPGAMAWAGPVAETCWEHEAMLLQDGHAAFPLAADDELIAVLVLDSLRAVDPGTARELRRRLARHAVQLQAALLFGRVRDSATSQERHRIAREVHDGVAQDVASLGYLVDNLAAGSKDPAQQAQIALLRRELTRVVTELRHSIFDLRHEIAAGAGLGESLSAYANQVNATSSMTVHVTLDEEGPRLPGDVELELLRIAQEAMANARKHSGAENLWLRCTVRAPYAEIEVGDDGQRAHAPRPDSQGLSIMRERSRSIGADLSVDEPSPLRPGTRVRVRVGPTPPVGSAPRGRVPHPETR